MSATDETVLAHVVYPPMTAHVPTYAMPQQQDLEPASVGTARHPTSPATVAPFDDGGALCVWPPFLGVVVSKRVVVVKCVYCQQLMCRTPTDSLWCLLCEHFQLMLFTDAAHAAHATAAAANE